MDVKIKASLLVSLLYQDISLYDHLRSKPLATFSVYLDIKRGGFNLDENIDGLLTNLSSLYMFGR